MSSSFEDSNSFLFGLNHFTSPQPGGSHANQSGMPADGVSHNMNNRDGGSASLLDGLEAFGGHGEQQSGDLLEGGTFAEQLALWTNANFSFDGPTGHALLGDEEKDKDEKDKDEDEANGDRRAGKRSRNNNNNNNSNNGPSDVGRGLSNAIRSGKNRLRDENDVAPAQSPAEPTHQTHKEHAVLQQQQHYFAPPSSKAEEARRPGFDHQNSSSSLPAHANDRSRSTSNVEGKAAAKSKASNGVTPNGSAYPFGGSHPSLNNGASPHGVSQAQFGPQRAATQGSLDLTSLLALQQLLSHNPLALATLGSFNNLNPQLGTLGSQLGGLGTNLNGQLLQQLQHQLQQQQAQPPQHQPNGSAPFAQNGTAVSQPPYGNTSFNGWSFPNGIPPFGNGAPAPFNVSNGFSSAAMAGVSHSSSSSNEGSQKDGRSSFDEGSANGNGDQSTLTADERAELHARRAAERDNIPPLKLIDTGNPEADAEANRVAIEEDKRRRNTAASARFRMKKKQREAALEQHTKELEDQVSDLRDELNKLRNENQWLKGLIQVRSGGNGESNAAAGPSNAAGPSKAVASQANGSSSSVEALQAAQQLQALQHAVSTQQAAQTQLQAHMQRTNQSFGSTDSSADRARDNGIRPRGVGTQADDADNSAVGQKRDRED